MSKRTKGLLIVVLIGLIFQFPASTFAATASSSHTPDAEKPHVEDFASSPSHLTTTQAWLHINAAQGRAGPWLPPSTDNASIQCAGSTRFFLLIVYLNSCDADALVGALTVGVGGAALCALLPLPPQLRFACGAVAASLTINAGLITIAASRGTGIRMIFTLDGRLISVAPQ